MKAMSIKKYLKPLKGNLNYWVVNYQILYNRTKAELSTGIRCKKLEWDETGERFKSNSFHNQSLAGIDNKIWRAKNDLDDKGIYYEARDIKVLVHGEKKINIRIIEFYKSYWAAKQNDKEISKSTIQKYEQTLVYLEKFLKAKGKENPMVSEIDSKFIHGFNEFLKLVAWNEFGDSLTLSTMNKHHSRFRTILNDAIKKEFLKTNPYISLKLSFPNSKREYLTQEELEALQKIDLANNESLDRTRDIFLFSCFTGLRYQDAIQLKMENIITIKEKLYLKIDQIKTGERREIPILDNALDIIKKYSTSKERIIKDLVLPTLSNQKINQYLKIIANLASIKKPLSHHIARHTCATTILLDNKVPLEMVSHWLGHNSVRTTQIYAKISHSNLEDQREKLNLLIK